MAHHWVLIVIRNAQIKTNYTQKNPFLESHNIKICLMHSKVNESFDHLNFFGKEDKKLKTKGNTQKVMPFTENWWKSKQIV